MKNTTIAIDLAKSVFEVGVSDRPGHVAAKHRLSRTEIAVFMANQPATTVIMEACSSAHYWGRTFQGFGHEVKLLPPLYVRPYVQRGKTDRADVKGMLEAWRNSDIRSVPVKSESQQQLTALHRIRAGWMTTRTMRINSAGGLLREFGIVFPLGAAALAGHVREVIADDKTNSNRRKATGSAGGSDFGGGATAHHSRCWLADGNRHGRLRWRGSAVSIWSPFCCVPGIDSARALQRFAAPTRPDQQARRRLPANPAHSRSSCRPGRRWIEIESGPFLRLGAPTAAPLRQ
jgi:hypothetical protein